MLCFRGDTGSFNIFLAEHPLVATLLATRKCAARMLLRCRIYPINVKFPAKWPQKGCWWKLSTRFGDAKGLTLPLAHVDLVTNRCEFDVRNIGIVANKIKSDMCRIKMLYIFLLNIRLSRLRRLLATRKCAARMLLRCRIYPINVKNSGI